MLLCMISHSAEWMKPMPPMSAASWYTSSKVPLAQRQRLLTVLRLAQIELQEFVGGRRPVFVRLDVHPAHPVAFMLESFHQMSGDEPACAANQVLFS